MVEAVTGSSHLQWPPHFPARSGTARFFTGVRWLGPDLSFFQELRDRQAQRTESCMTAWANDAERNLALCLGGHLSDAIGWSTAYFLPADEFRALAYGPHFRTLDELLFEAAIIAIERHLGIRPTDAFWSRATMGTFGELVSDLLKKL